MVKNEEANKR